MSEINLSATALNYQQLQKRLAYERLASDPLEQAQAIAKHYAAHATVALHLLKLLEMRPHVSDTNNTDFLIERLVQDIKRNHMHDFGIELYWPPAP